MMLYCCIYYIVLKTKIVKDKRKDFSWVITYAILFGGENDRNKKGGTFMSIYDTLNPMQKEAVLHTEGPLLILAGAGSGRPGY